MSLKRVRLSTLSLIGRVYLSAFLLAMGQDEADIAPIVGESSLVVIKAHRDFPSLVEHYQSQREGEDFAISALRGAALLNLLKLMATENPNVSLRATIELLDRIGLPSMSKTVERIIADSGEGLTLVEERRTLELTGITTEERARLISKLFGARGDSLLRLNTSSGTNS